MSYYSLKSFFGRRIKQLLGISNFTIYSRRKWQKIQRLFYRKTFTADDIIYCIKKAGVPPGKPIIIHSAMGAFYNFKGSANELIDKFIEYVGPQGTVCMPAYPVDKYNTNMVFDVRSTKSGAGYLTEVFRQYPNVKRSLNQLHSVCALGHDADYITREHHLSDICFDEHSPYHKIAELGGFTINLGMPKWYVGTAEHICEAKLYGKLPFFTEKFKNVKEFTYLGPNGESYRHRMHASADLRYIRKKNTRIIDVYFDKNKYKRIRLSNLWITVFDVKYLCERLTKLAENGITIYATPKFF